MNIQNNNINKLQILQSAPNTPKKAEEKKASFGNNVVLPSVYPAGQSQINANLPVQYTQIGEISVPGLKDNARVYRLANGQRVIIAKKKGPTFIRTTYNVGSLNEPDNIRGMSHYIEHNLFNGSKNLAPKEYDERVSALGGYTNASTSTSVTDYYLQLQLLHDDSLEEAIKLNAEQTQFPTFPNDQLVKEKEPVKSEIDICLDDSDRIAYCKTIKNLYNLQSTSEDFIIGTKGNINSFTRDMVLDYYNTWYTPDNAVTVITGDVDIDETINLVAKHYNKQNDYSNINKRIYEPLKPSDKPIREDIIRPNTTSPSVTMGFAIPEGTSEFEIKKLETLFSYLKSTDSQLYKELDKMGVSFDFDIEPLQNKPQGAKAIILTANAPEEKLEEAIEKIYKGITDISNYMPPLENVENTKKSLVNGLLSISEYSQDLNSMLTQSAIKNDYNYINSSIAYIQNITPFDLSSSAKNYLDLNRVSICVSHDKDATPESINNGYKKGKQISFGAKVSPMETVREDAAKVQQYRLPNNIETSVITGNSFARSHIIINFDTDDLNSNTAPEFMLINEMLKRGSSLRGADGYNTLLNKNDIGLSMLALDDGITISADCDNDNIQNSLSLIKEKLFYPNFTQEEFDRAKQLAKEAIMTEDISAFDKLNQEFFPEIKANEDKETRLKELENLTLADIQNFYSKILTTAQVNAAITVPEEANQYYTTMFNNELAQFGQYKPYSLERGKGYNIYKPNLQAKTVVDTQEKAQAEIVQGYKYKKSKNVDDIAKIELLNLILGGGGMSSRLFLDLREDKKLAYHVSSRISGQKDTGVIMLKIGTTTQSPDYKEGSPANVTKALEGFERNVNRLKTENVTEKELQDAKNNYKASILDRLEANSDKVITYSSSKFSPYNLQFNEKLLEAIDKITVEDIKSAANYVFKNPPVTSIVANKKTLEELNLR